MYKYLVLILLSLPLSFALFLATNNFITAQKRKRERFSPGTNLRPLSKYSPVNDEAKRSSIWPRIKSTQSNSKVVRKVSGWLW